MKSLFDEEPIKITKEKQNIPSLLPMDDDTDVELTDNQKVIVDPILPEEAEQKSIQKSIFEGETPIASGTFFIKGEDTRNHIIIEMNPHHTKYSEYYHKLKDLLKEMQEHRGLLEYTSG